MQQSTMTHHAPTTPAGVDHYQNIGEYLLTILQGNTVHRDTLLTHAVHENPAAEEVLVKAEQQATFFARQFRGADTQTPRYEFASEMLWEYARHISKML